MSMAGLKKIERISFTPAEWVVTTTKDKKLYVKYSLNVLEVRMDSPTLGKTVMRRIVRKHNGLSSNMLTRDMLLLSQFKTDNDWMIPKEGGTPSVNTSDNSTKLESNRNSHSVS